MSVIETYVKVLRCLQGPLKWQLKTESYSINIAAVFNIIKYGFEFSITFFIVAVTKFGCIYTFKAYDSYQNKTIVKQKQKQNSSLNEH